MKLMLQDALHKAASEILEILSHDPFPASVYPECLCSAVRSYPVRGGKRIRPALVLWSCGALGGDIELARNAAAAVEVYHSWTLVHDDIIDEDDVRRGQPSTHAELKTHATAAYRKSPELCAKFGRDFAILAGDIQQAWAIDLLMRSIDLGCDPRLVMVLTRRLQTEVNRELISGEALDVELPMRDWRKVSRQEVLKVIAGKTVCLLRFCVQTGASIALGSPDQEQPELRLFGEYAAAMGTAFQLRDDYLGIFGDFKTFGKPLGSDFQENKPNLLALDAMAGLSAAGQRELLSLTGLPEYPMEVIRRIRTLLTDSGAAESQLKLIREYTDRAQECLRSLPESDCRRLLTDLTAYLLDREV
ncbi:MAG: polyprenyl synthetase family protein [Lentisphaeria bacterium]|nr:polyprenyl synthetase family protein [Lentisphaeria bacterium]